MYDPKHLARLDSSTVKEIALGAIRELEKLGHKRLEVSSVAAEPTFYDGTNPRYITMLWFECGLIETDVYFEDHPGEYRRNIS